jgi:hypothetical protein
MSSLPSPFPLWDDADQLRRSFDLEIYSLWIECELTEEATRSGGIKIEFDQLHVVFVLFEGQGIGEAGVQINGSGTWNNQRYQCDEDQISMHDQG